MIYIEARHASASASGCNLLDLSQRQMMIFLLQQRDVGGPEMPASETPDSFWLRDIGKDVKSLIIGATAAMGLLGGLEPFVQLSKLAQWLVAHWKELITDPISQLLLIVGIRIPAPVVSLILVEIFLFGLIWRPLVSYAWDHGVHGILSLRHARSTSPEIPRAFPMRSFIFHTGVAVLAFFILWISIIAIHAYGTSDKFTEMVLQKCFTGRDAKSCPGMDNELMKKLPDWSTVKPVLMSEIKRVVDDNIDAEIYRIIGLNRPQFIVFALGLIIAAVAYLYYYRALVDGYLRRIGFEDLNVAKFGFTYAPTVGASMARIFVIALSIVALGSAVDYLLAVQQWLKTL